MWRQDCKEKNRKYLNLIRNASFNHSIAITGHVGTGSKVSVPSLVASHELNQSAGSGCREGLERQAHLCSFSFPGSHISWGNLVFSNHCNIVPYFCGYFRSFSSWGGGRIFFPPQCVSDNFPDLLIILLPDPRSLWQPIWHLG